MASKVDCESSLFNLFLIKDNLVHNKVDLDFNFFQDISSFGTKYHSPPEVKQSFKNFSDNQFLFFVWILLVRKRTLKTLNTFTMHWTSDLVSFACLKHGLMIVLVKIRINWKRWAPKWATQLGQLFGYSKKTSNLSRLLTMLLRFTIIKPTNNENCQKSLGFRLPIIVKNE